MGGPGDGGRVLVLRRGGIGLDAAAELECKWVQFQDNEVWNEVWTKDW